MPSTHQSRLDHAALRAFKERHCDENRLIAGILRDEFGTLLRPPLLDVGAGFGDIAAEAFPHLPAVLIDLVRPPTPRSPLHLAAAGDFLSYNGPPAGTVLFIHVLQYLDDDMRRLEEAMIRMAPSAILTVTNDNSGLFGEIIRWAERRIPGANPEYPVDFSAFGPYQLVKARGFDATIDCPSFEALSETFLQVLLDTDQPASANELTQLLERRLLEPRLTFGQTIRFYERIAP